MLKELFPLALQGIRRKKRSSRLVFSVLLVSFAFTIVSISLVSSISRTNEEQRYDSYGQWYLAVPTAYPEDKDWLRERPWVDTIGTVRRCADIALPRGYVGLGTADDGFIDVGHLRLDAGRWPEADDEIALEARTLELLGYDETLDQEIQLPIVYRHRNEVVETEHITFKVCGIIHEYSSLWMLENDTGRTRPMGAMVTPQGAERVLGTLFPSDGPQLESRAKLQLYLTVNRRSQETALQELREYMDDTRQELPDSEDKTPCINYLAYAATGEEAQSFYTYMIGVVAMAVVLCAYIMQLPAEIKSFATLRSIGITKPQLGALLLMETTLLTLPAILLGIPVGMGLTWLALKLTMYTGAVSVHIPMGTLLTTLLLWLLMVLVSRAIVFLVTVHTPLVGRFRLGGAKARRNRRFRSGLISLLLLCYGIVVVYTAMGSSVQLNSRKWAVTTPGFSISAADTPLVYELDAELFRQIPGVRGVDGISARSNMMAELSFDGFHGSVQIIPVDDSAWEDILSLGEDREAFRDGEFCLLHIPDDGNTYVLPRREVSIGLTSPSGKLLTTATPTPVKILRLNGEMPTRTVAFDPYAIICSHAYMERLISSMEPGTCWNGLTSGKEYGYQELFISVDLQAKSLSTEKAVASICEEYDLSYYSRCEDNFTTLLKANQSLILLYAGGASIGLVLLFVLSGAISLETEQEKLRYGTLRVLGMSRRQVRRAVIGKICLRALLPLAIGWAVYLGMEFVGSTLELGFVDDLRLRLRYMAAVKTISISATVCILVTLSAVCLLGKRGLMKGEET